MNILSLNCGSSSIKFQLLRWEKKIPAVRGTLERVGIQGSYCTYEFFEKEIATIEKDCPTHKEGLALILHLIRGEINERIDAVGHRVVHGGEKYKASVNITGEVLTEFKRLSSLAPLHNPPSILGIEAAMEFLPSIPQVAVLDTAWHQTMLPHAYLYALPYYWYEKYGIRRYGFHGTSYFYVARRAAALLGKGHNEVNLIICHLGNGSSINAVKNGKSYDTSMGFTPLEGLVMGTRAGNHDPAIGFYVMEQESLSIKQLYDILNKRSGILGITGEFSDRRDVIGAMDAGHPRAKLALEIEEYSIKKYIGAYYAVLGNLDAIVFTGGVGEGSPQVREIALSRLEHLGIKYDPAKNQLSQTRNWETDITAEDSRVRILIIPTDEEMVIAEEVVRLLSPNGKQQDDFLYDFQSLTYENPLRKRNFLKELLQNPDLMKIVVHKPRI